MELIDTHCHIDVEEFDADRDAVIARARQAGVTRMLVPAVAAATWVRLLEVCRSHAGLYPALGLHPVYQTLHEEADLPRLERMVADERPLAIGEIGLDFYIQDPHQEEQLRYFEAQLTIARDADLPVVVHARKSHDAILMALKKAKVKGGICHAFNGSLQQGRHYIDLGFKLGFGGMMTFPHSNRLRGLARQLPLSAIVLETDAPDLTVAAHRGERNSPEYLPECLTTLAQLREMSEAEVAEVTNHNAFSVLGLGV